MNIKNLLKEIDSEKEKMISKIELYDTELLYEYYNKDAMFLAPLLFLALYLMIITSKTSGIGYAFIIFTCMFVPFLPFIFGCFKRKKLSFSYYLKSVFKKEKLKKDLNNEKNKVVSSKPISNEFLKRIALNMEESEFELLLKKGEGKITLNKIKEFLRESEDLDNKENNIKNLTKAIYTENKRQMNKLI